MKNNKFSGSEITIKRFHFPDQLDYPAVYRLRRVWKSVSSSLKYMHIDYSEEHFVNDFYTALMYI